MLNKAIAHGKEKRKPYKGAKSVDLQCRNHGSCSYCMSNRTHKNMKRLQSALEQERAAHRGGFYDRYIPKIFIRISAFHTLIFPKISANQSYFFYNFLMAKFSVLCLHGE